MPCGCMGKSKVQTQGDLLRGKGGYLATYYNDDGKRYTGPAEQENVYCVGRGTAQERFFGPGQLEAASAYAQEVRKTLVHQAAGVYPNAAMTALFESVDA